ncbi:L,D-transpeptidase family protein [Pseudanabaena sp. PCC 6802]|uniref:L,D-transpeptidase family protein n=1 Tax=Pseudanabaena sp. PCC 6802 TaxID=118173 RepID=UPI00035EA6E1|nr:L,D-transpeptidase [Pseudanabaena sp. PCC 6802]
MIGPKRKPQEFGFSANDFHLIVNDVSETVKAYSYDGKLLWELPCLARGQYGENEWRWAQSDTPPGLYLLGDVYRDLENADSVPAHVKKSYGWITFDMGDLEGNEDGNNRAGICLHGGGSACGWPGAWEPYQTLYPTYGCVRMHNADLTNSVLPLYEKGRVFLSVYQES